MRKFYSGILLVLSFLLTTTKVQAQTADQYFFTTCTGVSLDPMTGATQLLGASVDDDPSAVAPIGFTFNFEGVAYTQFSLSPDGFMKLGGTAAVSQFTNTTSSTTNIPKLFPHWEDMATGVGGWVKYITTGTAPNRILKVEWFVTIPRDVTGSANTKFQVWLYEGTDVIEFRYGGTPGGPTGSMSAGIRGAQNSATAGVYKFHNINTATHTTSTTTQNNANTEYPGIGRSYIFTPPTACTGTPVAGSIAGATEVCSGNTTTLSLCGATVATGLTYQWLSSTGGGPFQPIAGANSATYTPPPITTTTSYTVTISCGAQSATASPLTVTVPALFPGGIYTINGANPTGGTNFQTFADAVEAISCGISSAVIFNVTNAAYDEQISIPQIPNASSTNTITFNGNGATLQAAPTTSLRHIIQLNGADWVTFNNLNILVQSGFNFGWGIHLTNGADNNTINNCTIDVTNVTSTTQSNSAGIVVSGSNTSVLTDGSASNNTISNNTINGAYQGIIINGATGSLDALNNVIRNNTITNFYATGIELTETNGTLITENDISRANRGAVSATFTGIELGTGNRSVIVSNNKIHDTHNIATTQTGTANGILASGDAPAGSENRIFNNLIYNFNSGSGPQNGLNNNGANGHYYYHNTIVLNDAATTSNDDTKGIFQTTSASNIQFRNNIIYITRGGTGDKIGIHFATAASTIISNNNVIYVNATPGFTGRYGTTNFATLANWQTANSGAYDQQSLAVDPVFADAATANFYPNNSAIASIGAPVGVTTDILGTTRSAGAPTPGAYEVVAAVGTDMGAVTLITPPQQGCYSGPQTITVQIRNYSASTHNFLATPVTVNVAVAGPNATTFTPVVVNTGTLAPDGTRDVVISTTYDMSAAGSYSFTASTTVTGDANNLNDAMPAVVRVVEPLEAGTASANPTSYCVTGGVPTIRTVGSSGGTLQWQVSLTGAPGSWTNVGTADTFYIPGAAITATNYYRAYSTCGTNSDTTNVVIVTLSNPQLLTTVPGSRCGPGTVTLGATGSAGATLNWYQNATGGAPLFSGNSFTTPIISNTTTYYVAASEGGGSVSAGRVNPFATSTGFDGDDYGLVFDALQPFTLTSVDVYPTGAAGSITVQLVNSAGTVIQTAGPFAIPAGTGTTFGTGATPFTLPLNFLVPQGDDFELRSENQSVDIVRDNPIGTNFTYPLPIGAVGNITSGLLAGAANTNTYYFFYNWQVGAGCESPRTAVTATIAPAPAFDITNTTTVCNNAVVPLQVNSSLASFDSYTWAPLTGLFADPNATVPYTGGSTSIVFAKIGTAGTYTYIATANNSGTNCQNIDSLHLTVLPAAVTVSALPQEVCVSGPTTLSYAPFEGFGDATAQWFSSPNGTSYNPITNATGVTFTTAALSATTFYKLEIKDAAGNVCLNPTITVNVNNPLVVTANGATRCGPGTLDLTASGSTGAALNWYTVATGGVPVFTGANFTTPSLNATTTYYVGAQQGGGNSNVGLSPTATNCGTRTTSTLTDWPLRFNTTAPVVINSAWVIPTGTSLTVALRNALSGTNLQTASFTFTAAQVGVPQQITLGWSVPASGSYQLTNTAGGVNRIGTFTCTYPYVSAYGGFSIVGSATTSTSATNTNTYNSFFNINVSEGCESPRTAVTATVSPNTGILSQPVSQAVCTGANVTFSVDAEGANLTYQWRKGTTNIANATSSTLVLNAVTVADAGTYNVVITGLCGNVTSADVTLTVAANNAWLGVISNDWNTPGNWCGGVPTATSDVVITAGTPFAPVVNGIANVRNLSINAGTSVTVSASAFLNIFGDFSNSGTFTAPNGFVAFKGAANQNIGAMNAGTVIMNGTGGITLVGNMTIANALVLTSGNITLGANNLVLNGTASGSAASHVITNGTGSVVSNNINADAVTVPVGPNATSYNPVIISNGQGRNYAVRVATGINPAINNPNRAINRTWNVTPNTAPSSPVNIVFQFVDADMNTNASATLVMEAAVHNGTTWNVVSPATGVTPSGTPTDRQVGISTTQFGPTVIGNFGAITFPTATANVDADVTSMVMMPNVVNNQSVLRVHVRRTMAINWSVVDANGRIVMSFSKQMLAGQNDIQLVLGHLAGGAYQIVGSTEKGKTGVVRFVKL